jgi:translocation and assembly module TamB
MTARPRWRRGLHWAALILAYLATGLVALLAVALLAINLPPISGWVATRVNAALEPVLRGRVLLHRLGHLDLGGITGAQVEVLDPEGRSVLAARGIDVRLSLPKLAWQAVVERPQTLRIPLDRIALEDVAVTLIDDGTGTPSIAGAFEPREPSAEEGGGGTEIVIDELSIGATHVRGALAALAPIEVDLEQLSARLSTGPSGTHAVLTHLELAARQLPQVGTVTGTLTADVTLPSEASGATTPRPPAGQPGPIATQPGAPSTQVYSLSPAAEQRVIAAFDGNVGGSDARADVRLVGQDLAGRVEMPAIVPATLTRLVPALAPSAPLALSANVDGRLTDLGFEARVSQEPAVIAASGRVTRDGDRNDVRARLEAARVDLSRLLPEAAKTALALDADATLELGARGGSGRYRLVSSGSSYAGEPLPETTVEGRLELPAEAPVATQGKIAILEAGAPTNVEYRVTLAEAGPIANVNSLTRLAKPKRLGELAFGIELSGEVASRARYDATRNQVDAELRVNVVNVRSPEARAARVDLAAMARGSATAPNLELLLNVTGARAADRSWSRLRVHALGTSDELNVTARAYGNAPDEIDARAVLAPSSTRLVRSPVIRIKDEAGRLAIRAAGVTRDGERLSIDGLSIEGAGSATASVTLGKELERLELETRALDAARLLRIAGVKSPLRSAKLDLAADFVGGRAPRGTFRGKVSEIALGDLRGGAATANLELRAGKVTGNADVQVTRGAKTTISVKDVRLPRAGETLSLDTMTGDITLLGDLDLAHLQPFLPFAGVERATGHVDFDLAIRREPGTNEPAELRAKLRSRSLVLVSERADAEQMPSADQARVTAPWTLRDLDFEVDAGFAERKAKLAARVFDRAGDVLAVYADMRDIGRLSSPREAFARAPFNARVLIPRRELQRFPAPIRPAEYEGAVTLQVDADGTLSDPHVEVRGRIDGFSAASESARPRRVDVELGGRYRPAGGTIRLEAHDARKVVLGLQTRWSGDVARAGDALAAPDAASPLLGDVAVRLDEFPIDLVPQLENRHIHGKLTGTVELEGLGRDARLSLDVGAKRITMDRLILDNVSARAHSTADAVTLEAGMAGGGGDMKLTAKTGLAWGKRLVPVPDQQIEGSFAARDFPLAALEPLVDGTVSELAGKLDANIRARLEDGEPRLEGQASLEDGVLQLPAIGQRFSDIGAKIVIAPGSLRIEDLAARGISGGFEGEAEAVLRGLAPVSAKGTLRIEEEDKLPLTVEGEAIGDAWGAIDASFEVNEAEKQNRIAIDLRKFHVDLPGAPPQGIQDLAQAEHIRVGYWRRDREFVTVPLQPMEEPSEPSEYQTVVHVDLGETWISKGDQVEVGIGGQIEAKLGPELDVTGKIETRRGELFVSGKSFEIERGTVTFTGGPPDTPTISAVARYDAPAGYTVYAEYTGTATEGKLGLRSEPPLSQDEILTLLMFGTPDGSFGAGSQNSNSLSTAVSVVGGTAAQGLNRALSKVTDLDVSARVDTSTGAPRPELVLQLSPRVAARVTQALGEPSPGQSPDRTFVTLELRIASAWALSTMVGDRGATAFDVIWRRRY